MMRRILMAVSLLFLSVNLAPAEVLLEELDVKNAKVREVPAGTPLAQEMRRLMRDTAAQWAGYTIESLSRNSGTRCYADGRDCCCHCSLETDSHHYVTTDRDLEDQDRPVLVLFRLADGKVDRLKILAGDCSIDFGGLRLHLFEDVDPGESLTFLESLLDSGKSHRIAKDALQAVAYHVGPTPDRILDRVVRSDAPHEVRKSAIFWTGAARGEAGYRSLKEWIDRLEDVRMRREIPFALHVNDVPESTETLIRMARRDRSGEVRAQAIFWLGQEAGRKASEALEDAVDDDPDIEVKKKAVFALSQLPPDEGVPILIRVARTHRSKEVRKKAMFWLGQTEDRRALDFFEEVLLGRAS